ncbi:MAG: mismatch-specific DNA-glycosylase [Rhodospirillaceae bacterium]|nr:mismatch-specific DNA-glycosylase [Rhodospirillaceae bacterium]MBT7291590.1 mismatch-specific DNA-glycosylase [Rhodospirillaceae bacterium]
MNQRRIKNEAAVLADVLADGLGVVFCGSAAGTASAKAGAYYAGPGNRFWPMLYESGLTPRLLAPHEFLTVLQYGVGLTDLSKFQSGADSALDTGGDDTGALAAKITRVAPRALAFNGKRAAGVFLARKITSYGLQAEQVGSTAVFVLPSTSGAARRWWDATPWMYLAQYIGR